MKTNYVNTVPAKMVLFDAGLTLVTYRTPMREFYAETLARHGVQVTETQLDRAEPALWTHMYRLQAERGLRTTVAESWNFWTAVYEGILTDMEVADAARLAVALHDAYSEPEAWQLFPDVAATLQRLRACGARLGVVSNWTASLPGILHGLGVGVHFDFILTSAEVGVEKPDPAIFEPALDMAGVPAGQILYVGDSLKHDLPSATAAGLQFALVDRLGQHPDANCFRISSLHELVAMMEQAS